METEQVSEMLVFNSTLVWLRFQYLLTGLFKNMLSTVYDRMTMNDTAKVWKGLVMTVL
jgi:hypothetical protein